MGRAGESTVYRCHTCELESASYSRIERHVDDEHGGGRIEIVTTTIVDRRA